MHNFINEWTTDDFSRHLKECLGWTKKVVSFKIAGDGNMNFTYRLVFDDAMSIIVKQSPPFCARFPDIPAPEERILSEFKYYDLVAKDQFLSDHSPALLGLDDDNKIAYISDLGDARDFDFLYKQAKKLDQGTSEKLIQYLVKLHQLEIPDELEFDNLGMRKLNHSYIFDLPFRGASEAIDLNNITPGLTAIVRDIINDENLKQSAKNLGDLYFQKSRTLIHGDYYPMSWIETKKGLFVIDPEFGFLGLAEIDLGVFLAHMLLSNNYQIAIETLNSSYGSYDSELVAEFAAAEVIRRIVYVSQLPLINSLSFKKELLLKSAMVLKTGDMEIYEKLDFINS